MSLLFPSLYYYTGEVYVKFNDKKRKNKKIINSSNVILNLLHAGGIHLLFIMSRMER